MGQMMTFHLSVLFLKEGDFWVAQCLQFDITSQGKSIADAQRSFERVLVAQIICDLEQGREALSSVPQAPAEMFELFKIAEPLQQRDVPVRFPEPTTSQGSIPPPWMIPRLSLSELRAI